MEKKLNWRCNRGILQKIIFCGASLLYMVVIGSVEPAEATHQPLWYCRYILGHSKAYCKTPGHGKPPKPPQPSSPPLPLAPPPEKISLYGNTYAVQYCSEYGSYSNCLNPRSNAALINAWKGQFRSPTSYFVQSNKVGEYDFCKGKLCMEYDYTYVLSASSAVDGRWKSNLVTVSAIPSGKRSRVDIYMYTDCVADTSGGFTCGGSEESVSKPSNVPWRCYANKGSNVKNVKKVRCKFYK